MRYIDANSTLYIDSSLFSLADDLFQNVPLASIFTWKSKHRSLVSLRSAVCHLALVYLRTVRDLDVPVLHDPNPIIMYITRARVEHDTLTAHMVIDRLAGFSVLQDLSRRYFRELLSHRKPRSSTVARNYGMHYLQDPKCRRPCRPIVSPFSPSHCRYRPLLRSRASTWVKGIKKIHQKRERERERRTFAIFRLSLSANTLDAKAKEVEE